MHEPSKMDSSFGSSRNSVGIKLATGDQIPFDANQSRLERRLTRRIMQFASVYRRSGFAPNYADEVRPLPLIVGAHECATGRTQNSMGNFSAVPSVGLPTKF
jgi:hypothetical protein